MLPFDRLSAMPDLQYTAGSGDTIDTSFDGNINNAFPFHLGQSDTVFLPIVFDLPFQEAHLPILDSSCFEELDQPVVAAQSNEAGQPLENDQDGSVVRLRRW